MNVPALLAELHAAGVHISREGDNLKVRGEPADFDRDNYFRLTALLNALAHDS